MEISFGPGGNGESFNFILGDLAKILKNIEQSTLGTDSADDFSNLFEDLDLPEGTRGRLVDAARVPHGGERDGVRGE